MRELDIIHIPYKGDAPLTIDLVAGRAPDHVRDAGHRAPAGEGRAAARARDHAAEPESAHPGGTDEAEAGLNGVSVAAWGGRAGAMTREVVDRLAREMSMVLERPEVREGLDRIAFEARSSTPEELSAFVKEQLDVWRRAVLEVGIALE